MRALTYQGKHNVSVETVPDPEIIEPDDALVRVTTTGVCGSDLHLYEVLGPFLDQGDVLGHEAMGVVEEIGPGVTEIAPGDRVVMPFNVSCGTCWMCGQGLHSQCETTQVRAHGTGAALFGYSKLYGQVPGGQAEYLRVPFGNELPVRVPDGPPDERFVYLSDVLPTAWQAVAYADIPAGGSVTVLGLGPIGDMACRIAMHQGAGLVIGVDLIAERLERARARGVHALDTREYRDLGEAVRELTRGRGTDAVIDAVGMEAHGAPLAQAAHRMVGSLPKPVGRKMMQSAGVDRLSALHTAFDVVRRGGTVSVSGVYGGAVDPLPMLQMFDKQIQLRMGQANVRHWVNDIMPLLTDDDPLDVDAFATHMLPLENAAEAYGTFQRKEDGMIKTLLKPAASSS
ncbi:alcohol dehydrogenase catalytic domain-containing protein [Streptomyces oceani]|uniref:Molecular chaperone GroES n=1 Tax=Streptomyces oceani TaxID=1075402 RepID=A0A1E7KKL5_9ACTN|nr:alcohol dehydrogenase catalytic domain-containing protein [Streptomyces oceani]OEV04539.1 molecular chaperone GroES [Streptomyces oceani]